MTKSSDAVLIFALLCSMAGCSSKDEQGPPGEATVHVMFGAAAGTATSNTTGNGVVSSGGVASCGVVEGGAGGGLSGDCASGADGGEAIVTSTREQACPDPEQGGNLRVQVEPKSPSCIGQPCWEKCDPCEDYAAWGKPCPPPAAEHYRCDMGEICGPAVE